MVLAIANKKLNLIGTTLSRNLFVFPYAESKLYRKSKHVHVDYGCATDKLNPIYVTFWLKFVCFCIN